MTSLFFQQIMEDKEIQRKKGVGYSYPFFNVQTKKMEEKTRQQLRKGSKTMQKYVACFKKITTFKKKYMK